MANFGNDFAANPFECGAVGDVLGFAGRAVALALDDLPREDDVLEIEDGEIVIVKFVRGMG